MRSALIVIFIAFFLSACGGYYYHHPHETPQQTPPSVPPSFPVSPAPGTARLCGGMVQSQGNQCLPNEFCRRTIGDMCGAADAPGQCTPVPEICTQEYAPVCGCDDRTYSNECVANSRGVSASYAGECR